MAYGAGQTGGSYIQEGKRRASASIMISKYRAACKLFIMIALMTDSLCKHLVSSRAILSKMRRTSIYLH